MKEGESTSTGRAATSGRWRRWRRQTGVPEVAGDRTAAAAGKPETDRCTSKRMSRLAPEGAGCPDDCVGSRQVYRKRRRQYNGGEAGGREQRRMIDRWGRARGMTN